MSDSNVTDVEGAVSNMFTLVAMVTEQSPNDYALLDISVREDTLTALYLLIGCTGFLGNALVVAVLFRYTPLATDVTNVFIVNQSVIDSLTALFLILTTVVKHDGRPLVGVADDIFCRLWMGKVPIWSLIFSSTYNLVMVTFERYLKIVHPVLHKVSFTPRVAMATLIPIWIIGPLFNIPYDVISSGLEDGYCMLLSYWPSHGVQKFAGLLQVGLQYFLPLAVLGYCYGRMAYTLHKKTVETAPHQVATGAGGNNPPQPAAAAAPTQRSRNMAAGRNSIIKTLAIVTTAFVLCSSCNQWFFFLFNLGVYDYRAFSGVDYHFSVVAMFANCCVNPFIYTAKYKPFQAGLRKMFGCKETPVL